MPQEPKRRHSRERQGKRRTHIRLSLTPFVLCENCKNPKLSHTICKHCGYYNGRPVLNSGEKKMGKEKSKTSSE